jgi:hypothetical protein
MGHNYYHDMCVKYFIMNDHYSRKVHVKFRIEITSRKKYIKLNKLCMYGFSFITSNRIGN